MIAFLGRVAVLALLVTGLAACANTQPIFVEPTAQAILVKPVVSQLLLRGSRGGGLPSSENWRLVDFLRVASEGRLDAVHLKIYGTNPYMRHAVVRAARRSGVDPSHIVTIAEIADPQGLFAIRVVAERLKALPPVCPSLVIVGPSVNDNDFDQTLGCSQRANLALTVNDPADLLGNGAVVPADGERAAIPVERYRTFSTGASAARAPTNNLGNNAPTGATTSGGTGGAGSGSTTQ